MSVFFRNARGVGSSSSTCSYYAGFYKLHGNLNPNVYLIIKFLKEYNRCFTFLTVPCQTMIYLIHYQYMKFVRELINYEQLGLHIYYHSNYCLILIFSTESDGKDMLQNISVHYL